MNYSKEELTEYNGERGFWRTINGRAIFISIEKSKKENEEKIKNFFDRKQSNMREKTIQNNIDEANNEYDRKLGEARNKYKELRDRLQNENLSQEERDKIKEHMNALVLFHGSKDKEELEREFTKKEPKKVRTSSKKVLEEKTNEPREDNLTRRTVTDPYIKFAEKTERQDLEDIETIKNKGEEYYYRNYAIEQENKSFNQYSKRWKEKPEHIAEHNERLRTLEKGNAYLEDSEVKAKKEHLKKYKDPEHMAREYKKIKETVVQHFLDKGRKYNDDLLMQNAERYADDYMRERTKKWIIK